MKNGSEHLHKNDLVEFWKGKNLLYRPAAAHRHVGRADPGNGLCLHHQENFSWRSFKGGGVQETKQGWFNTATAGTNCPFRHSKLTTEGICTSTAAWKRDKVMSCCDSKVIPDVQHHIQQLLHQDEWCKQAGKWGDRWGTRWWSTVSQVPYLHEGTKPKGDLRGTFALLRR